VTTTTEVYANDATTTVTAGGQSSSPTDTNWTVASAAGFPVASISAGTQFHVADPAQPTELITVTATSGNNWTVIRGAEGTQRVAHAAGFTIWQVVSAADLTGLAGQRTSFDIVGYGGADPTGSVDATTAISNTIAAAVAAIGVGAARVTAPAGTFLINSGTGFTITAAGLVFTGASTSPNWTQPTGAGTIFHLGSNFGGSSLFTIAPAADQVTLAGFTVTSYSPSSTVGITAAGTSGNTVDGLLLKNVFLSQVGGVTLTYVTRSVVEDVVAQATNTATAALSCSDSTIVYFDRCNFAPVSTAAYAWYFTGCETIVATGCQGNNNPAYSLYLTNTNDSTFTDFEANGGSTASVQVTGCTDIRFASLYASGSSTPTYVSIINSSIIQILGGWLNEATGSAVIIDGTGGAAHDVTISGMLISTSTGGVTPVSITATNVYNVTVTGNSISGPSGSTAAWLTDNSTSVARAGVYTGNTITNLSGGVSLSPGPNVAVVGNAISSAAGQAITGGTDWINVTVFGADPSGAADSTAVIQAAITAAKTSGAGVYFPAGTYKISASLNVGGGSPGAVTICGDGWESQIFLANGSNAYIFDFGSTGPVYTPGLTIRDLYLNCNGTNQTSGGGGIFARGAVWCVFDHLWIEAPWGEGLRFYQDGTGSYGHHNTVQNCLFKDGRNVTGGAGLAMRVEQADENRFIGCTFQDCGNVSAAYNGQVHDTSAGNSTYLGCAWVGGATGASFLKSDSNPGQLMFSGCSFDGPNTGNMLDLQGTGHMVTGCNFINIGQGATSGQYAAVYLDGAQAQDCVISGCSFAGLNAHATAILESGGANSNNIGLNNYTGTWLGGAPVALTGNASRAAASSLGLSPGGTTQFLRADGNWAVPSSGTGTATALASATTTVNVSSAAAPASPFGQALTATSATTAIWQHTTVMDVTNPAFAGGAQGNGTHDDGPAILAAMNAASAVDGVVYFPATSNWYNVAETVVLSGGSSLTLQGDGYRSVIKAGGNFDIFQLSSLGGLTIQNLRFDSNATGTATGGAALNLANCANMFMIWVQTNNVWDGLYSTGSNTITMFGCFFHGVNAGMYTQNAVHAYASQYGGGTYGADLDSLSGSASFVTCAFFGPLSLVTHNSLAKTHPNKGLTFIDSGPNFEAGNGQPPEGYGGFNLDWCGGNVILEQCWLAGAGLTFGGNTALDTLHIVGGEYGGSGSAQASSILMKNGVNITVSGAKIGGTKNNTTDSVVVGTTRTDPSGTTQSGASASIVLDPLAVQTDLNSLISGTGIPTGATITAVNSTVLPYSYTISAPATIAGSTALVITQNVDNVIITGNQFIGTCRYCVAAAVPGTGNGEIMISDNDFTGVTPFASNPVNYPAASAASYNIHDNTSGPTVSLTPAAVLQSATTNISIGTATAPSVNQVLTAKNSTSASWQVLPSATTSAQGVIKIATDLGGTAALPQVIGLHGNPITAPSGGASNYLDATGNWSTPAGGGGGGSENVIVGGNTGNGTLSPTFTAPGTVYTYTLTGAPTFSFPTGPSTATAVTITLYITPGTGAAQPAGWTNVTWLAGVAPIINLITGQVTVLVFENLGSSSTTWYGSQAG